MKAGALGPIAEVAHRWSPRDGRHVVGEQGAERAAGFVKGPLPLGWLQAAAALPGKALHIGLCLWYLAGLTRSRTVRLTGKTSAAMGVSRDAKGEALKRLAQAGLITLAQRPGCAPEVTIRDPRGAEHSAVT